MRMMWDIEQPAGNPSIETVDPEQVDRHRRITYQSYEHYLRQRLQNLDADRPNLWKREYTNIETYLESVDGMREQFKRMLGFWIEPQDRLPVKEMDEHILLETDGVVISRFTFEILPGLTTYAVRMVPGTPGPHPGMLIQHGYMGSPELACGLTKKANAGDYSYRSLGFRAAKRGYHVIAPHHPSGFGTTGDEIDVPLPDFPNHDMHYGKNRLHRLCLLGGGTLMGLDMLASSRAVDLLTQHENVDAGRLGMYGLSRGGQSALYLPAMDQRIKASVCSAYFNTRLPKLIGPYTRTNYIDWYAEGQILPNQPRYFSDSDIASLIVPRAFAVEAGALDGAIDQKAALEEWQDTKVHYEKLDIVSNCEFIAHAEEHVSATKRTFEFLAA